MSRRIPSFSDLNIRSEQPVKRFKTAAQSFDKSSYRNIYEQFDDVLPTPTVVPSTQIKVSKTFIPKQSTQQQFSSTSSSTARSIMTKPMAKPNDDLWSALFQPKTRHDLIIHPKKVKELEEALQRSCEIIKTNKRPSKLILISGPSGSGKSTCLRVLADSLNINIVEWETRTTSAITSTLLDEQRDSRQSAESQKHSFRTFLFQSTRYLSSSTANFNNGLIFENENEEPIKPRTSSTKQLVLIEVSYQYFY